MFSFPTKKGKDKMCTYDLCIKKSSVKMVPLVISHHFLRMFYLCFILTAEMMYSHNKNLNRHFQSCLLFVSMNFSFQHVSDAATHTHTHT